MALIAHCLAAAFVVATLAAFAWLLYRKPPRDPFEW
jgi:hypothetical protein